MSVPDNIQLRALETWYDDDHHLHDNLQPSVMGLAGEAGEMLDLLKKHLFKPGCKANAEKFLNE